MGGPRGRWCSTGSIAGSLEGVPQQCCAVTLPRLPEFQLERYFARHEFTTPFVLCASDVEPLELRELLLLADDETHALWEALALGYTPSEGHPLLRREIAGLYEGVDADDIVVCTGAEEAVYLCMRALLAPGDHAVVGWPAYQSLRDVARATGADVEMLDLDPAGGWLPDPDDLARRVRSSTRLVIVNFPHNPTGALPDRQRFLHLVEIADRTDAHFFSDEVYRYLEYDPADRLPAGVESSGRGISVGVMSKAFGLAGLRIGWVACRDRALLHRIMALKDYTTICNSAPSEVLALIALRARDRLLARSQEIIEANLDRLRPFFQRWTGVLSWVVPRGGAVGFPDWRGMVPVGELITRARVDFGVLLLPGSVFDFPGNRFRLGFGRADFPQALEQFDRALTTLVGER